MFRLKSLFAVLTLTASAGLATAQTAYLNPVCDPASGSYKISTNPALGQPATKTVIAGSSAMWVTMALGAYNQSHGIPGAIGRTHHYVSVAQTLSTDPTFSVVDTRPKAFGAANPSIVDNGQAWVVWDERTTFVSGQGTVCAPNVWVYLNTDSVVGNRVLFASIGGGGFGAYIETANGVPAQGGGGITGTLWGTTAPASPTDNALPAQIAGLFTSANEGVANAPNLVTVGATDIRPEDAFWATTRANSVLGPLPTSATNDGRDGLGYVSVAATGPNSTTSGAAPANCTGPLPGGTPVATLADLVGQKIQGQEVNSAGSKGSFNVVAFNITGLDPFTCVTLPATHVIPVGAAPIMFIHSNNGGTLNGLSNATQVQLGTAFSGGNHNASLFGLPANDFVIFLREALSGTYNTTEASVMRHPSSLSKYRFSMETGVDPNGGDNPLNGNGNRFRAIGTGREVTAVKNAAANHVVDGIGFTFFSYGNVSSIADSANYSYIMLEGVDPIFHNYVGGTNGITDPGQPATAGMIPGVADLPATCAGGAGHVPCDEHNIWAADHSYNTVGVTTTLFDSFSFPNLRNGSYKAWSVVRLIAAGAFANATALVNASNTYAVTSTPDYVPFNVVKNGATVTDPGLQVLRAHYGCTQATCGLNFLGTAVNPPFNSPERGRDAGGLILPKSDIKVNFTQDGIGFVLFQ